MEKEKYELMLEIANCIQVNDGISKFEWRALAEQLAELVLTMDETHKTLKCDMKNGCLAPVTKINDKGYLYCDHHGQQCKANGRRCRKLRAHEIKKLERDEIIKY